MAYVADGNDPQAFVGSPNSLPAGGHYDGVNAPAKDKARILDRVFYAFKQKRLPTIGVGNYAFTSLQLPKISEIGAATAVKNQLHTISPVPWLYYNGQALPVTGLGGVLAGQIVFQPLANPTNNTVG